MHTLRECLCYMLSLCMSVSTLPAFAQSAMQIPKFLKVELTDGALATAVGGSGSVDAVMIDYQMGGATAEAVVANRSTLYCTYELNLVDANGLIVQTLVTGTLAPNTAAVLRGKPPVAGTNNRYIQARIYSPGLPGLESKDSSFASKSLDSDGDGITDANEILYGLNPYDASDAKKDLDSDGLTNIQEINIYHTNPTLADTDGDGIKDGAEIRYALNPLDPADGGLDPDHDFMTNAEEINVFHTDPNVANPGIALDTDKDGLNDKLELGLGLDPNSAASSTVGLDTAEHQRVLHILNRLSFGPTETLIAEVQQMGTSNWVSAQLIPIGLNEATPDPAQVMRDAYAVYSTSPERLGAIRPVHSPKQLQSRMALFWDNHFSTDVDKTERAAEELYEEDEFFVNAFGNFETLLKISAKNYTMLQYLDLIYSNKNGPNENYAREVMELHTLGQTTAGGVYTSTDVKMLAKIFTGFSARPTTDLSRYFVELPAAQGGVQKQPLWKFYYEPTYHDIFAKTFLGIAFPAGVNSEAEGDSALHMLATHPATAQNICTKLAQRFVADTPAAATVNDCKNVFLANTTANDQIAKVLQSLFNSAEFNSPANYAVKFKDTQEFMLSLARFLEWNATDGQTSGSTLGNVLGARIYSAGQPMFHYVEPTGWLETANTWTTSNVVLNRFREGNLMTLDGAKVHMKDYFISRNITTTKDIVAHLFLVLLGGKYNAAHMEMAYWALHPNHASFSINDADAESKLKSLVARIVQLPEFSSH